MTTTLARAEGIDSYREYLIERDGDPDLLGRKLSKREGFFADILAAPITSQHHIDRDVFLRNLHRRRPEAGLSPQMYWLLATAKLNQAERFGVALGETYGINAAREVPIERIYLELEEHYHTRLLAYVLDMFGLPFQTVAPSAPMRQFVKSVVFTPRSLVAPLVGAAEMAGCALFALLGARGSELFADEPAVAERIRLLYNEILTDEIGHVGYCAASCNAAGRGLMRRLYPLVGRYIARGTPEVTKVVPRAELIARLGQPFELETFARGLDTVPVVARHP